MKLPTTHRPRSRAAHGRRPVESASPSAPPGWCSWKSSGPKPCGDHQRDRQRVARPPGVTVVEAVGTRSHGSALALDADVDHRVGQPRTAPSRRRSRSSRRPGCPRACTIRAKRTPRRSRPTWRWRAARRPATTMPASPWSASAACTKNAGVPVLASVAASLAPTRPDLPSPVTTTRPRVASSSVEGRLDVGRTRGRRHARSPRASRLAPWRSGDRPSRLPLGRRLGVIASPGAMRSPVNWLT